ncbi:MAG TPA: esterase-like activity of phytase family protein [Verrucomicrobiae bacterium]
MLTPFAKSIQFGIFLGLAIVSSFSAEPTAKGNSLGVRTNDGRKHFTLTADATWQLNVEKRFDASALAFRNGRLITVNDQDGTFYELELKSNSVADLKRLDLFPKAELTRIAPEKAARYDLEGIALDAAGNIYVSEESQRLVFKADPKGKPMEAFSFDFSSVQNFFSAGDRNASFEGIALLGNRLYLANERSNARIIEVDLPSQKALDSFYVDSTNFALGGPHYSDLATFDNRLFVLDRNHRCIFEVDPQTKRVLAQYSFGAMEVAEEFAYQNAYPTGAMEGLAIDQEHFWLLTDNNGRPRFKYSKDIRPTLFRCKRPKAAAAPK